MCFETTKSARAKIAKTNIECWKVIRTTGEPLYQLDSKVRYNKVGRKLPKVVICLEDYEGTDIAEIKGTDIAEINRGYHSYRIKATAEVSYTPFLDLRTQEVRKFIIPAGTRYYENKTEYVSETIMLVK